MNPESRLPAKLNFPSTIADIRGLDIFGTDRYWYLHDKDCETFVGEQMKKTMDVCEPCGLTPHFWAQGFGIPARREKELEPGFKLAMALGAQSVAVWGMRGNAARGASENPEVVWEVVGKVFWGLRK